MATVLRPLTLGELLDRTFTLYRRHVVVFVGIVALPNLVVLALQLVNLALGGDQASLGVQLGWLFLLLILSVVVLAMSQAASVVAVSELHLDRAITIAGAFRAIRSKVLGLCGIMIAVGVLIGLGFLFLILPGIYLMLRWSLVVPVAVLEDADLGQAMSRSGELTRGHIGRILVIYLLYFLLVLVFTSVWTIPVVTVAVLTGGDQTTLPLAMQVLLQVGEYIMQSIFGPLLTIAMALVYYDERVRKEAFDLEHMLAQLDARTGPSASPA